MYWNHSATTCSVKPALLTVLRWSGQTACNTDVNLGNVEIKKKKKVPQCGKGRSGLICGATEFPLIPMDWRAALPAGWQTDEKKWSQYDSKNRGTKPRLKISRNIQWLTGKDDRFFTVRWFCSTVHTEVIVPLKRSGCVSMLWAMLWINEQDYFTTILNI